MGNDNYLTLDSSILYRCNAKYYDKILSQYGIGYSHLIYLVLVHRQEGIPFIELVQQANFDKGAVTKSIKKLVDLGYINVKIAKNDKRLKEIYLTDKARLLLPKLYRIKNDWWKHLSQDLNNYEKEQYLFLTNKLIKRAKLYNDVDLEDTNYLRIFDLDKFNLSVFDGKISAVIETGNPTLLTPYDDKKYLSYLKENFEDLNFLDVYEYLNDNKDNIEAICLKGGEVFSEEGLINFLKNIKKINFKTKVETYGLYPEKLKECCSLKLIDVISFKLISDFNSYEKIIGSTKFNTLKIKESLEYLLSSKFNYEISLVLVKKFHEQKNLIQIRKILKGARKLVLFHLRDSSKSIEENLECFNEEEINNIADFFREEVKEVIVKRK